LQFTAKQVEKLRNELSIQFALLSDNLKRRLKNRKALTVEYANNIESLKSNGECFHSKVLHFYDC
jgi:hypothetical protein